MAIIPNLPDISAGARARDAEGVLTDVQMLIRAITPEWTDLSDADPGVALAQVFAYLMDHTLYQVERGLLDATLLKGSRRLSALFIARALGYEVDGPRAASTTLRFTLTGGPLAVPLTIPKDFEAQGTHANVSITLATDADLTIPAGSTIGSVAASEGVPASVTLGVSDGSPFQAYKLQAAGIVHNRSQRTAIVSVDGEDWTEVSSFVLSGPGDRHHMVFRDELDRLTFVFGDGAKAVIPNNGLTIAVRYRVGGGRAGNVPAGTIISPVDSVSSGGVPVALAVINTTAGVGGLPRESLASIQRSAPAFFATQDRAVSRGDFGAVAGAVSGALRARASRTHVNTVEVRIVPAGWTGAIMDAALKASVEATLDVKRMVTDRVVVRTADPVRPRITIQVTVRDGRRRDAVKSAVIKVLEALYAIGAHDFGGTDTAPAHLFLSDMIAAVDNVEGVDHLDVAMFTRRSLLLGPRTGGWDMSAGNATLGDVSVGAGAAEDTWTIEFDSAVSFIVRGLSSGHQLAAGVVNNLYTSDDGQMSFTVTAGVTPMAAGNRGRFKTSRAAGNIPYTSTEHPTLVSAQDLNVTMLGGI